eukprot:13666840-Alexandrium_andersonii.AAC.1
MSAVIRSTSHEGMRRHSRTALAQAGDNLSNALLWSISTTARLPRAGNRPQEGGVELVVRLTLA